MRKKSLILFIIFFIAIALTIGIPNISNAAEIKATQEVTEVGNGSMDYIIEGLDLDSSKEYEWALEKTKGTTIENWYDVADSDFTNNKIKVSFVVESNTNTAIKSILSSTDVGYLTVREKNSSTNILTDYELDLKLPLLKAYDVNFTNYQEKETYMYKGDQIGGNLTIRSPYYNISDRKYTFEKITDTNIINEYIDNNHDISKLTLKGREDFPDITGTWYDNDALLFNPIDFQETGLYYVWIIGKNNLNKTVYGQAIIEVGTVKKVETNANGSSSSNSGTSSTASNSGQSNASGTTTEKTGDSTVTTGKTDPTVATKILPNTGIGITLSIVTLLVIGGGIYAYIKNKKLKDV